MSATEHFDEGLLARPTDAIARLRSTSLGIGAVGLVLAGIGFFTAGDAFWQSYLIAYWFWIGITLGSLALLMIHHLTGGAWGMVARRVFEAATRTLPLMAVLFVPIWLKIPTLYEWSRPEAAENHFIHAKHAYLNVPFFTVRAVLYFVILGGLIYFLNKWSKEQDEGPLLLPGPIDRRFRVLSGPGLVLFVLCITFMSVDWIMSLDAEWYSTIFGVLTLGGQGLSTLALTLIVLAALSGTKPLSSVLNVEAVHDISKLMFGFLLLWGYFNVSQLIIIWSANLPEEIPFYLERLHGVWAPVSIALLIGQFVLPFLLLLSRDLKRNALRVRWVALFILVMRVVDITWTVGPVFRQQGSGLSWVDFALVLAIGGVWLAYFWSNLAGRAVVPAKDPYFKEALAHGGH